MLTWQNCTRKKERPLQSTWPSYIKGNTVNGKIYAVPVAANVASSQNFAFNGPLLEKYGIDISNVKDYALEPVLKAIKEKIQTLFHLRNEQDYGGPSDDFDYPVVDGLPFVGRPWRWHY